MQMRALIIRTGSESEYLMSPLDDFLDEHIFSSSRYAFYPAHVPIKRRSALQRIASFSENILETLKYSRIFILKATLSAVCPTSWSQSQPESSTAECKLKRLEENTSLATAISFSSGTASATTRSRAAAKSLERSSSCWSFDCDDFDKEPWRRPKIFVADSKCSVRKSRLI